MQPRILNPAALLPGIHDGINALYKAAHSAGAPKAVLELVHLRASQINGCSPCVDSGARNAKRNGETDERLFAVAAWRDTPYFTDAERALLARKAKAVGRKALLELDTIVSPDTLLRWHRRTSSGPQRPAFARSRLLPPRAPLFRVQPP